MQEKTLHLRMDKKLRLQLEYQAKLTDTTKSDIARRALQKFLDEQNENA